jgi:hypothetical protein
MIKTTKAVTKPPGTLVPYPGARKLFMKTTTKAAPGANSGKII